MHFTTTFSIILVMDTEDNSSCESFSETTHLICLKHCQAAKNEGGKEDYKPTCVVKVGKHINWTMMSKFQCKSHHPLKACVPCAVQVCPQLPRVFTALNIKEQN